MKALQEKIKKLSQENDGIKKELIETRESLENVKCFCNLGKEWVQGKYFKRKYQSGSKWSRNAESN